MMGANRRKEKVAATKEKNSPRTATGIHPRQSRDEHLERRLLLIIRDSIPARYGGHTSNKLYTSHSFFPSFVFYLFSFCFILCVYSAERVSLRMNRAFVCTYVVKSENLKKSFVLR